MKKILTIIMSVLLVFSLSSCCLLFAGIGGVAAYSIVQKYGKLIYFGDFWFNYAMSEITKDALANMDPDGITPNEDGTYTYTGRFDSDKVGQFATYKGPIIYNLDFNSDNEFESLILNGVIDITEEQEKIVKVTGDVKTITFQNVEVIKDGKITGGTIKVDTEDVPLDKLEELKTKVMELSSQAGE